MCLFHAPFRTKHYPHFLCFQLKAVTERKSDLERHLEKVHEEKETVLYALEETQDKVKVLEKQKHEQEAQVSCHGNK